MDHTADLPEDPIQPSHKTTAMPELFVGGVIKEGPAFPALTLPAGSRQFLSGLAKQSQQMLEPFTRIGQQLQQALQPLQEEMHRTQRHLQSILKPFSVAAPLSGIFGKPPAMLPWPSYTESTEFGLHKLRLPVETRQQLANLGQQWHRLIPPISSWPVELRKGLHRQQQAFQAWQRRLAEDMRARPDFYRDLEDLLSLIRLQANGEDWATLETRDATIHRLVTHLPLGLADRSASAALRRMTRERDVPRESLLGEWLFPEGVLLAVQSMFEPRYIRLGKCWVKDRLGRKLLIAPIHLLPYEARHWLFQEVRNAAEAILLNRAYPQRAPEILDKAGPLLDAEPGPAVWGLFLLPQSRLESEALLDHLTRIAPPREHEVLCRGLSGYADAEIAATLGIKPGTVRVLRWRLKKRLARLLSA